MLSRTKVFSLTRVDNCHKQQDFTTMILGNLKKAGVQNTRKEQRLTFDRLNRTVEGSLKTTVVLSGAVTLLGSSTGRKAAAGPFLTLSMRWNDQTTSSAVSGLPS